jgi:P27 family predicted phage terminase small subunit
MAKGGVRIGAGSKPKPTALHKLRGTFRQDRHGAKRKDEPQPDGNLSDPPHWFTDSMREGWDYVMEHAPKGMLKRLDRGALVLWVEAEDRHRQATIAQAKLNEMSPQVPYLVKGPDGLEVSPYIEVIDKASKIMMRMIGELGFSPCARPRIRIERSEREAASSRPGTPNASPWALLRVIEGRKDSI